MKIDVDKLKEELCSKSGLDIHTRDIIGHIIDSLTEEPKQPYMGDPQEPCDVPQVAEPVEMSEKKKWVEVGALKKAMRKMIDYAREEGENDLRQIKSWTEGVIDTLAVEREPVAMDAIESELETRKIACPRMAICNDCGNADICPNKKAREQLEALKARVG